VKVLISGASGFVGRALTPVLITAGHTVVATSRHSGADLPGVVMKKVAGLGPDTDWRAALEGIEAVVHLAARVHIMNDTATDPLLENRRINTQGTIKLAEDAALAGVKRFVFLSTVKVMGEATTGAPFCQSDTPSPQDAYAIAKLEAEQALADISTRTGMQVVIIRPPLVYGPGVGGNFATLLKVCARGWPLPLGAVNNRRSLIYVGNLAHAIAECVENPAATGKTYLVRDGEDISTAELITRISAALDHAGLPGRRPQLWPLPPVLLRLAAGLVGKSGAASRLLGDLGVDDGAIRKDLDWTPPFSMVQGLNETANFFAAAKMDRHE